MNGLFESLMQFSLLRPDEQPFGLGQLYRPRKDETRRGEFALGCNELYFL